MWFKPRCWPWVLCITRPWGLWHIVLPFKNGKGNAEIMPQTAALWLGEPALLCKSHTAVLYQSFSHPGDRVHAEEPCGKRSWRPWVGQGPSELQKHERKEQNWLSVLAAPGKSRKREWRCSQQLEGRLIFPLKLGNHFLTAAVTARVSDRSG